MVKINKNNLIIGLLFFITFFGYFNFHINIYFMCVITLLIAILMKKQKINKSIFRKNQWGYLTFMLALLVTTITSYDKMESIKYFILFFTIYLCSYFSVNENENSIKKIFIILCWIEVICLFLQSLGVGIINNINDFVLPNEILNSMYNNIKASEAFSGIAGDLPNIMFFSYMIFIYYFVCYLVYLEKKYLIVSIAGLVAIFLCGKRSGLIILAISLIFLVLLNMYNEKKLNFKLLIVLVFLCGIALYILVFTNAGNLILNRNNSLSQSGDYSNGRLDLIKQMIQIFKDNPIFGIGTLATKSYYGTILGHNIYMQVLSENGAIGLSALLYMLFNNFYYSLKCLKDVSIKKQKEICLISISVQIFFIIYGFFW